ncbi:MAG: hypothetical protein HC888_17025 [Candidatus Competibacteraceae bacterium]|nr:hypothetical protein [Candidatus Competibacteraceae bacterium]
MEVEEIVEHFRTNYSIYIAVIICLLPVVFFTRKYSLPAIFYTIEILIYLALMHVTMYTLVIIARWFKEQSSMKALHDPERAPDWQTPLIAFWQKDEYNPVGVYYAELVFVVVVFLLGLPVPPRVTGSFHKDEGPDGCKPSGPFRSRWKFVRRPSPTP